MNTLQERLKYFIASLDKSVLSFENQCGIAPGTVSKMSEKSRLKTLEKISKNFPQLNMNWLKTGEGEMLNKVPEINMARHSSPGDNDVFGNIIKIENGGPLLDEATKACLLEKEIEHLRQLLKERERVIAEKDIRIAEKDERIAELKERVEDIKRSK